MPPFTLPEVHHSTDRHGQRMRVVDRVPPPGWQRFATRAGPFYSNQRFSMMVSEAMIDGGLRRQVSINRRDRGSVREADALLALHDFDGTFPHNPVFFHGTTGIRPLLFVEYSLPRAEASPAPRGDEGEAGLCGCA